MDGYSGYNQIKMVEKEKENIAFISEWGAYAYDVMPFGLCLLQQLFKRL